MPCSSSQMKCQYCTEIGRLSCSRLRHFGDDLGRGVLPASDAGDVLGPGPTKKIAKTPTVISHSTNEALEDAADQEAWPRDSLDEQRSPRGSKASRTPSPKMLNASVVISSARLGNTRYHHAPYW